MKNSLTVKIAMFMTFVVILATPVSSLSQVRSKELKVQFPRDKFGTILKGNTPKPDQGDFDQYLLDAREKQMLRVRLRSSDNKSYLIIYSLDLNPPYDCLTCRRRARLREWSGRLPVTGVYSIQIYTESQGGVPYTLELSAR